MSDLFRAVGSLAGIAAKFGEISFSQCFCLPRQSRVYDPDGLYLKKWLPELREVEIEFVHTPWLMSEQQRLELMHVD
eukprot:780224-Amphidinium_carterae.1